MSANLNSWEKRKDYIGASDAPIILGVSPYKTPYQLWLEKLGFGPEQVYSPAMQRGHDLQPKALAKFEEMTGLIMIDEQRRYHKEYPWMMATIDGMSPDGQTIVEIKCPKKADHQLAKDGVVPVHYFPQLQHQLAVCGLDMVYYFSFDGDEGAVVEVSRDQIYIDDMIRKEMEFWECVQLFTPPKLMERDSIYRDDDLWMHAAAEFVENAKTIKYLSEKQVSFRESLISMAGNNNASDPLCMKPHRLIRSIIPRTNQRRVIN